MLKGLRVILGIAIALGVVVGVRALFFGGDDGGSNNRSAGPYHVAAPATIGRLVRQDDAASRRAQKTMRGEIGKVGGLGAALYTDAIIAFYGKPHGAVGGDFVVIANDADNSLVKTMLTTESDDQKNTGALLIGSGYDRGSKFSAGAHGGAVRCATSANSDVLPVVCAWTDSSSFGLVLSSDKVPVADFARTALAVRNATET